MFNFIRDVLKSVLVQEIISSILNNTPEGCDFIKVAVGVVCLGLFLVILIQSIALMGMSYLEIDKTQVSQIQRVA
ncbi:hypothetical protein [Natranaerobius thermophilus]|nr:hypothetical protein [Natranaerobius thermophilus]